MRDLHKALLTEVVATTSSGVNATLLRLQWSKDDIGHSLHVSPNSYTMSGLQMTDLLSYVGLKQNACSQYHNGSAYCGWVEESFDLSGFAKALPLAYGAIVRAEKHLQSCGLSLPQPEGWSHFLGGQRSGRESRQRAHGNCHSVAKREKLKESSDENFKYVFTWIEDSSDKGWVAHVSPNHGKASPEVWAVFSLLGLVSFGECPEFQFETCFWQFRPFEKRDGWGNADYAHQSFDSMATNFSAGIEELLKAQSLLLPFGMSVLPLTSTQLKVNTSSAIETKVGKASKPVTSSALPSSFDVAISFAGSSRTDAEKLATMVRDAGFSVFYDNFYPAELWGKNLVDFFNEIFQHRARHCVVFVSADYVSREWTTHERQSAQARAIKEKGSDYILPIRVDETELPGMPSSVGYLELANTDIDSIGKILITKLTSTR